MRSLGEGEVAVKARLEADTTFLGLVGTDEDGIPRVYDEWIGERVLKEAKSDDTYRATSFFRAPSGRNRGVEHGDVRIQVDHWVSQDFGGGLSTAKARLEAIDSRAIELIETQWIHDGVRMNGIHLGVQDHIGGHLRPLRRTREFLVGVR